MINDALAGAIGFFGTKAADFGHTYWLGKVPANFRAPAEVFASAFTAMLVPELAATIGLVKSGDKKTARVAGLMHTLNSAVVKYGKRAGATPAAGSFAAHMLSDYVDVSGEDIWDGTWDADLDDAPELDIGDYEYDDDDLLDLDDDDLEMLGSMDDDEIDELADFMYAGGNF